MNDPYETPNTTPQLPTEDITCSTDIEKTVELVADYFTQNKYRLESGTATEGVYGIGTNLKRLLLGAMAKRFKFKIKITQHSDGCKVTIEKGMSGAMGGFIDVSKMKKELARVREGIKNHLSLNF